MYLVNLDRRVGELASKFQPSGVELTHKSFAKLNNSPGLEVGGGFVV